MSQRETKRTQKPSTLVAVWVPNELVDQLDKLAKEKDSDRSKIIRHAIRKATA
jgi:metal-responsive CopG/Arc/MetJ family transcriptional regulator